jgi:PAS domain S-box-containing protein
MTRYGEPDGERARIALLERDLAAAREEVERLRATAEMCRLHFDNAFDVILSFDTDLRLLTVSPAVRHVLGYEPEELIGRNYAEIGILAPESVAVAVANTRRLFAGERIPSTLFEFVAKDGSRRFGEVSSSPLKREGRIIGVVSVARDVTERKQAQEEVRRSEEKFATVFRTNPDAITITRPHDGSYVEVNQGFYRVSGYTEAEVLGRSSVELGLWNKPADRERWLAVIREHGEVSDLEFEFRVKDGSIRTGLISSKFVDIGGERQILSITKDISGRKQAEAALRESEEKHRRIIENSLEAIYIIQGGVLKYCNARYAEMFGFASPAEATGTAIRETVDPANWPLVAEKVRVRETGLRETEHYGFTARRRDGTTFEVETLGSRILYEGRPAVQGVLRDVSERARLEAQLRHAQKMEAIGILAGGIAHDFNNLLTGIIGNLEMAERHASADVRGYLTSAEGAAHRAADLVRQILTFSRRGNPERRAIDPAPVIEETAKILRETIDRRIRIEVDVPPGVWNVLADGGQFQQVTMNLALNARDALVDVLSGRWEVAGRDPDEDPRLRIALANVTVDDAYCRAHHYAQPGPHVCLSVADNGPGMDAALQYRIFEPFFTTKEQGRGTGLGLAIVFGIVKQHDGWITVDSEPGRGATFEVFLPRHERGETPDEAARSRLEVAGGNERILLVDDEPMIRDLGRAILERKGYRVVLAADGREALDRFLRERDRIDLVILDLTMPYLSGYEVLERIQAAAPGTRVLLSSGYALSVPAGGPAIGPGVGFIAKPYQVADLVRRVREILDVPTTTGG